MHKSSHNNRVLPKWKRQAEYENRHKPEFYGHGYWARANQGVPPPIQINPLNPELNPTCYLLALLAHHFLHVSRIMVK